MQVLLAPSADIAKTILATKPIVLTVEAEYGLFVAEGSRYTAAHHQPVGSPYAGIHVVAGGRHSPCNDPSIPRLEQGDLILVSHVDLDTIGGVLRAMPEYADLFPRKRDLEWMTLHDPVGKELFDEQMQLRRDFWALAEYIDVSGPHKISRADPAASRAAKQLYAFKAWSKSDTLFRFPQDEASDVTGCIIAAGEALRRIFAGDPELLYAGEDILVEEAILNRRTFIRRDGDVIIRITDSTPCSHLYEPPGGWSGYAPAIASYTRSTGAVAISLADPIPGVSCRAILQELWGPEAGGQDGIAGSPREKRMEESALYEAVAALQAAITRARQSV